ncbi:type II toxin-antitoxin system RelE/ParE family toxin [Novispirillum sp. DQ9]|uniref:type II toxin-antitoxin system RelE/ParE family toxin n=1 Tax=Novispirillum sp. DQ9 TaxID=3398612 RepID=UPI003C7E1962
MIETPEFLTAAKKLLSEEERQEIVRIVGADPTIGDLMQGTGGFRKFRIPLDANNKGKSGGARVVYFFHDATVPVFLITVYPKNEKDNLSKAERNALKVISEKLVDTYREGVTANVQRLR